MNRVSPVLICFLAAILASSAGCARKPDDAKISSNIQSRFSQDSGLSTKQLTVQASNGVVTLAGYVDNDAQREAAARQAAAVDGVKEVVNNLQVGNGAAASVPMTAPARTASQTKVGESNAAKVHQSQQNGKPSPLKRSGQFSAAEDAAMEAGAPVPSDADAMADNSTPPASTPEDPLPADPAPSVPRPPPSPQKLTIEQGTAISIRLIDSIDSEKNQVGDTFHASLNVPLSAEGAEAIPAGTDIAGHIVDIKSAGKFAGQSLLVLQLDSITSNGRSYNLETDQYRKEGSSRSKSTAEKVGGGAILGGIIGAIAGGGKGAAIGTAAGAGVGGGAQAASKGQAIKLPSETVLSFTLQAPVTVIKSQDPNASRQKLGDSQ